jgi:hypothetical protein
MVLLIALEVFEADPEILTRDLCSKIVLFLFAMNRSEFEAK